MQELKSAYEEIRVEILFVACEDILTTSKDEWTPWY